MNLPRALRLVLVGVISLACGAFGVAQQSQKRPAAEKTGAGKATVRPPARTKNASASDEGAADAPPKRPRPQGDIEFKIEQLPKELEQLLKDWERESAKIKTLHGEHTRIVYNKVFEVQKIAHGQFYYEAPDKGRIDLVGIQPKKGEKGGRVGKTSGEPYKVEKEQDTKWVCDGESILNINDAEKTVETFELPKELRGKNIIHGPLPFLFGMKAEEAKKRFILSFAYLNDPKKNNDKLACISARPRQVMDRDNFQEAIIVLDRQRFLPTAVKLIDPTGNLETVYTFSPKALVVNKQHLIPEIFRNDPFNPSMRGYKRIQQEIAAPQDQKSDARDNRPKNAVRQASNESEAPAKNGANRQKSAGGSRPKK